MGIKVRSVEPGGATVGRPGAVDITDSDWCGLPWTPWAQLERKAIQQVAPHAPGIYRIRRQGDVTPRLTYVGQTGRRLRERLLALAAGATAETCPFNDPHTAAPHLWLLRHHDGAQLEFSCAPVQGDRQALCGTEDMLLWRHRVETGASTTANYGRFYPGFARPTNRWVVRKGRGAENRTPGRLAQPLSIDVARRDFDLVTPPLQGDGGVLQASWWQRARLIDAASLPNGPGVYCIYEWDAAEPVYIGETSGFQARSATHAATPWSLREPCIALLPVAEGTPKYVLHELESDLLGWHFWRTGRAPRFQYRTSRATGDNVA